MPVEAILALVTALVGALGPLVIKLFTAATTGGDVGAVLAAEHVADILGATSRLELAEQAARLRDARDAGDVAKLAPAQRALVDSVLAMHDAVLATLPTAASPR